MPQYVVGPTLTCRRYSLRNSLFLPPESQLNFNVEGVLAVGIDVDNLPVGIDPDTRRDGLISGTTGYLNLALA